MGKTFIFPRFLIIMGVCGFLLSSSERLDATGKKKSAANANAVKEVVEEDPSALSKTPHSMVVKWDVRKCSGALPAIGGRMQDLQRRKHKLYRDESTVKGVARKRKDLPEEYKKLAAEIARLKKEMDQKTMLFGQYMNNIGAVKDIRKERKQIDNEWRRLSVLRTIVNKRSLTLRTTKSKHAAPGKR
ncbi:MAG: hypothetical protein KAH23_05780 [Kiritimatiellae bacterium]|nr:hypothetical protein [Kiritimatiellia bacterium]